MEPTESTVPSPQSETGAHAYLLMERIGEGPHGVVWRGWRRSTSGVDRPVALKLLDGDRPPADVLESVATDAALLARFRHRAVAGFEDVLELAGRVALVSELVDGVDLGALLGAGALSPRATGEVLAEVLGALEAAHVGLPDPRGRLRAILHLNLKPGNVRVTRWGEVKLTDFVLGQGADAVYRGGTPAPPEAWSGAVGPPADVFAVGVLGWSCRTGRALGPLERSAEGLNRQLSDAFDTLWGDPLAPLLRRLLAWDPAVRPTAAQARRELAELQRDQHGPSLREHLDHRLGGRVEAESGRTGVFRMVSAVEPGLPGVDPHAQTSILMVGIPDPAEVQVEGFEPPESAPPPRGEAGWISVVALVGVIVAGFLFAACVALVGVLVVTRG